MKSFGEIAKTPLSGSDILEDNIINLFSWEVFDYFWGTAVREKRTGKWSKVYLKPDGREIDLDDIEVDIHENGIEFY